MTVKHTVIRRRERFDFNGGLEPTKMTDLIAVVAVEEEKMKMRRRKRTESSDVGRRARKIGEIKDAAPVIRRRERIVLDGGGFNQREPMTTLTMA